MPTPQSQSTSLVVSVGVECNVGKERTENQDRVTRAATPFGDLFVVADGVGGYQGGAEAAQTTVDGFVGYLNAHGNLSLTDALQQAVRSISADLQQRSAANKGLHGMGSTVVLCVVNGDHLTYAHAGDSRAYLMRNHKLTQLTRDHSVMERLVSGGVLTPEQAREHPDASVLTRAIGSGSDISLDIAEMTLQPDDALLLCSDGLWGYAKPEEVEAVATSDSLSASAVAAALLKLALEGGGGDNISVQFLRFKAVHAGKPTGARMARPAIALASILAVSAAVMLVWNLEHPLTPPATSSSGTSQSQTPATPTSTKAAPPVEQKATTPATKTPDKPVVPSATPQPPAKNTELSPKTKIVIIQNKDGSVVDWSDDLGGLNYLETSQKAGSDICLALEKSTDVLYYSHQKASIAKQIHEDVSPAPVIQEITAENLSKCGSGEMFAVPAKPTVAERTKDKVETGVQTSLDKAKADYEAAKKELEKQKGKLPVPH
jgi:serine/threonine protein phosphatase PrpC